MHDEEERKKQFNPLTQAFDAVKFLKADEAEVQDGFEGARDIAVFRKAQPLNNVAACQSVETAPFRILKQVEVHGEKVEKKKVSKGDKVVRNVLKSMHERFRVGPLSMLERIVRWRQSVRVVVRDTHKILGGVVGELVAFDAHFNIILKGVKGRGMIFVRGENVVLVQHLKS